MKDEGVLGFPCLYTFKVFGRRSESFRDQVREVIGTTVGTIPLDAVKVRESGGGAYVCVSVITRVHSRGQLERIYEDLRSRDDVILYL